MTRYSVYLDGGNDVDHHYDRLNWLFVGEDVGIYSESDFRTVVGDGFDCPVKALRWARSIAPLMGGLDVLTGA